MKRLGQITYWIFSTLAVLVAALGISANIIVGGGLIPDVGAIAVGGLIWLIGRAALYLLAGK